MNTIANTNNLSVNNRGFNFFDAHCHLQEPEIIWDIDGIISRWRENSGGTIVCCGTKESDWQAVANIASIYDNIIPCFGVHPWFVEDVSDKWFYSLEKYLNITSNYYKYSKPLIGEIGIDHVLKNIDKKKQEIIFKTQLGMAKELHIPVSIHIRKGWDILIKIIKNIGQISNGGVIHSYSGSADMIPILQKYGFYISFSGSVTHSNNKKVQKSLKQVSPERLLIETDSPAILPYYPYLESENQQSIYYDSSNPKWTTKLFQMGLNEPCNIFMVATAISKILDIPLSEVALRTDSNGKELFLKR
ncbi:MAG: TatD family hydrolase [Desulfamplus sp.]|nr:TatD family hydrolase [Desulfamplus sp.]